MQTAFSAAQLVEPRLRQANDILRQCVHCGFCTATCPTYVLLGDELDSPRGRIYLIKDMLEGGRPPSSRLVRHIDRCLSCLACVTTCPSGVDYQHLVDDARARIETSFRRPPAERALRAFIALVVPRPAAFRLALALARLARPLRRLLPGRLAAMAGLAPPRPEPPAAVDRPQVFAARGRRRRRLALMSGCAQQVLRPSINEATVRLLTRLGCEVVVAPGAGCCGALVHHMGRAEEARAQARANVAAWERAAGAAGFDAIVINASGCGTTVKDYGFMLADDPDFAGRAAETAALAKDVSEVVADLGLGRAGLEGAPVVAYHAACSMQHGQRLGGTAKRLLEEAGFAVREAAEGHLCCGSAGTYNLLQPDLARDLGRRKAAHLEAIGAGLVATGNIGCLVHLEALGPTPVVHTVELLDWATGGPPPPGLAPASREGGDR